MDKSDLDFINFMNKSITGGNANSQIIPQRIIESRSTTNNAVTQLTVSVKMSNKIKRK
jgi:hypothetical protein